MRTVKGNQQTAINRGKIHSYLSLGTGMGFITLGGVGRTPSFYSNMYMNSYLHIRVCTDFSINHKREKKGEFHIPATKCTSKSFLTASQH